MQNHHTWRLIASDDGSDDATKPVIAGFSARHPGRDIALIDGPRRGFAQNFLYLLRAAGPDTPFAALSDQDDIWLPGKLTRGLAALSGIPKAEPALYCGRTLVCDAALNPVGLSPLFARPPGFRNALVQSIAGGNTMILNRAALTLAQQASREPDEIVSHDWWLYQIVAGAGGRVIYDPEPQVLYRQHGANLVGANRSARARLKRLAGLLGGDFRNHTTLNIRALDASAHRFTAENRALLRRFEKARKNTLPHRLAELRRTGLHRQTRAGNAGLWCAASLGLL